MPPLRPLAASKTAAAKRLNRLADAVDQANRRAADVNQQARAADTERHAAAEAFVEAEMTGNRRQITEADKRLTAAKAAAAEHWEERRTACAHRVQQAENKLAEAIADEADSVFAELKGEAEAAVAAVLEPLRQFQSALGRWHDVAGRAHAVNIARGGDPRAVPATPNVAELESAIGDVLNRGEPLPLPLPRPTAQPAQPPASPRGRGIVEVV